MGGAVSFLCGLKCKHSGGRFGICVWNFWWSETIVLGKKRIWFFWWIDVWQRENMHNYNALIRCSVCSRCGDSCGEDPSMWLTECLGTPQQIHTAPHGVMRRPEIPQKKPQKNISDIFYTTEVLLRKCQDEQMPLKVNPFNKGKWRHCGLNMQCSFWGSHCDVHRIRVSHSNADLIHRVKYTMLLQLFSTGME